MGFIKNTVRELRKNQTEAENIFWQQVRNRKFLGHKFLRQHPIRFEYEDSFRFFVADFYCAKKKLIIEIDGRIHENQRERDEYRTYLLDILGYRIIRFSNEEVLGDIGGVLGRLEKLF